jgi:hypothetical protein
MAPLSAWAGAAGSKVAATRARHVTKTKPRVVTTKGLEVKRNALRDLLYRVLNPPCYETSKNAKQTEQKVEGGRAWGGGEPGGGTTFFIFGPKSSCYETPEKPR